VCLSHTDIGLHTDHTTPSIAIARIHDPCYASKPKKESIAVCEMMVRQKSSSGPTVNILSLYSEDKTLLDYKNG